MPRIGLLLKYGLLYTAVSILMLHSLVPHQHHTTLIVEPTFTSCAHSENSILGFLGKVFHQDLGSEHLDNYRSVKKVDFSWQLDFTVDCLLTEKTYWTLMVGNNYQIPSGVSQKDQSLVLLSSVRGPPSV